MMWHVFAYTVAVSLAVSLIGLCEEKLNVMRGMPRRFFWAFTMVLSIGWPLGMMLWMQPARAPAPLMQEFAALPPDTASVAADATPPASVKLDKHQVAAISSTPRWRPQLPSDRTLVVAWVSASGALLAWLCALDLLLHRQALRWRRETVLDRPVLVSELTGPALLGALRPQIVVPRWFLAESPATQSLILEHEHQHLRARDPLLLRMALLLAVMVPWNLPLWWQLRRLRRAIELDCDARVLRSGAEAASYGEVLLAVAQRAGRVPVGVVAMSEPASALEQRIANLVPHPGRHSVIRATAALLVWCAGIGVAMSFEPPTLLRAAAQATTISHAAAQTAVQPAAAAGPRASAAPPAASVAPAAPVAQSAAAAPRASDTAPAVAAKASAPVAGAAPASSSDDVNRMDLRDLIALTANRFKKQFVVDPRVRASVDMGALGVDSLTYHAFLEVLGVHGFVAVPSGDVVAIIPEAQMSQVASPIVRVDDIRGDDAEVVTVIIPVGEGASAKDLAALMRDLIPRSGYIGPTADNKGLMLVARVANVKRIAALVRAQSPQP